MTVDPGDTSGIAQAFLRPDLARSTEQLFRRALEKDAIRVSQIDGTEGLKDAAKGYSTGHVHQIVCAWKSFLFKAQVGYGIPRGAIYLVFEDFQLRQRSAELSPVQVTAGFECVIAGMPSAIHRVIRQPASEAKGYATDARLRKWGLWTVGKEHGRDATRHLALRASKVLDGK